MDNAETSDWGQNSEGYKKYEERIMHLRGVIGSDPFPSFTADAELVWQLVHPPPKAVTKEDVGKRLKQLMKKPDLGLSINALRELWQIAGGDIDFFNTIEQSQR